MESLHLCERRTLVGGVLYRAGVSVSLTDGLHTEYVIKVEETATVQSRVLPTCLRGTKTTPDDDWTAKRATECLRKDEQEGTPQARHCAQAEVSDVRTVWTGETAGGCADDRTE